MSVNARTTKSKGQDHEEGLEQGRATFSERGSDETFRSSSWAGVTNENPKMRIYITILLLQSRQISETADAACHEEVFQYPARRMTLTTEECHWDSGPRTASESETSCTSFRRRAVRYDVLKCAKYLGKFLEGRAMSRKKDSREEL